MADEVETTETEHKEVKPKRPSFFQRLWKNFTDLITFKWLFKGNKKKAAQPEQSENSSDEPKPEVGPVPDSEMAEAKESNSPTKSEEKDKAPTKSEPKKDGKGESKEESKEEGQEMGA